MVVAMTETRRTGVMGGMSLGGFSGTPVTPQKAEETAPKKAEAKPKRETKPKTEKLEPVNIKLPSGLKKWFRDRAEQVRANNLAPVPADERVYPQHLMQLAGEFLQSANINWDEAKNIEDIKKQLGL
jgi:hypothetical protein